METRSRRLWILETILFALAILVPVACAIRTFTLQPTYQATGRISVEPLSEGLTSKLQTSIFGADSFVTLRRFRNANLISIRADGPTPQETLQRASAATTRVQESLKGLGRSEVFVVD
jgi:hypothetical protein